MVPARTSLVASEILTMGISAETVVSSIPGISL